MEEFGKYQLVRRVGSGGMAEVFLAKTSVAQGLSKELVIKKIHPAFARSKQFAAMFVDEARIALGLNHPNIVQVFDFGQKGETYFLAMEYVEGMDLLRLMQEVSRRKQKIPIALCAYIVQQAAKGLDYAHRKTDDFGEPLAIVHRDISPQNVLLSYDGAVKIVDFGIARARDVHEEEGVVKGKFAYMPPEQARGELVDRRADVYSAGVVLFELATGRPLYPGKGKAVLEKVKAGAVPRPKDINPDIPDILDKIILRTLTYHKDDRYQTGRDLQNALGQFQLEHSRETGTLCDSGTLAQFIARIMSTGSGSHAAKEPPPLSSPVPNTQKGKQKARSPELAEQPTIDAGRVEKIDTGVDKRESRERKHVFVIEGQLCGVLALERRLGRRESGRILQDFLSVARDIAFKHEAYEHRVDEGGLTLVVGLPMAKEEDPTRTIRLALALIDALDGIGLDVEPELRLAVGIQRGVALVRKSKDSRFGYELSATTTGMARHLAGEAQGGDILCGGAVSRIAREWNFEELATIDLPLSPGQNDDSEITGTGSGGGQRARVYRVRGRKERAQRLRERGRLPGGLIGRNRELEAIRGAFREVALEGRHRRLVIVGEEGVGKGALVSQFLAGIEPGKAHVLRAAARAATSYTPLGIVADLGRDLMGLAEGADSREVTRRLEQAAIMLFPEDPAEGKAVVKAIAPLLGGRVEGMQDMDSLERAERLKQVMVRMETQFSLDRPLVVVVEDGHWADEQSLEVFRGMIDIRATRGLMAIFTARPEDRMIELAKAAGAELIRLDEMDEESRLELITRRFAPDDNISDLTRAVLARTGGNPLFIVEMIDALVDRGILVPDPPGGPHPGLLRWKVRDASLQMPATIESLLVTRIDQLPTNEKQALVYAAVLGRRFRSQAVDSLVGSSAARATEGLVSRGLLRKDGSALAFRNDLTMGVAYGLLPAEERSRLHKMAANNLAESTSYRKGQDDALIARHLELAGDMAGAADRYLRAAAHAVDVGGSNDAFRQLTRALKLLPKEDHKRRFDARCQREIVLRRLAKRPAQLRELDAMRREAEALQDPSKLALAHARQAQFYLDVRKLPSAEKSAGPALEYARKSGDVLAEADAVRLHAEIARLSGDSARSLELSDEALALCDQVSDSASQRADILNARGNLLWGMGRLDHAIDAFAETLVIYRMLAQPRLEARALNNMGVVFATLGEPEEALAHYKSSLKLDQDLGDRASIALKLGNIGQCYADLGDLDRGERYLSKALKIGAETDETARLTDSVISMGQIHYHRGQYAMAIEKFDQGLEAAKSDGDHYQVIRAVTYTALSLLEIGDSVDEALEMARQATELSTERSMAVGQIYGLAAQGLALAKLGRPEEGFALTKRAVELQEQAHNPEGAEEIHWFHARVAEAAGELAEAQAAVTRGLAEVEKRAAKVTDANLKASCLGTRTATELREAAARLEA